MTKPILTPELMARAIVSESDWWHPGPEFLIDFDRLREHIAQAIAFDRGYTTRAAIEAEREACAQICEELTARRADEIGLAHYDHLTGHQCAAAIRARTT